MIFNIILLFPPLVMSTFTPPANFCEIAEKKCVFEEHKLKHLHCSPNYMSKDDDIGTEEKMKIEIKDVLKESILKAHNRYRNALACGNVRFINTLNQIFPKATQMPVLSWDDELQWSAEKLSSLCIPNHDECRITPSFLHVGQNLGILSSDKPQEDPTSLLNDIIWNWFLEFVNTKVQNVFELRFTRAVTTYSDAVVKELAAKNFNPKNYETNDFIQMVQEKATKVGCGLSLCRDDNTTYTYFLVCNYNAPSVWKRMIYKTGDDSGSDCKKKSGQYCCLCKTNEGNATKGLTCDTLEGYQEPKFPCSGCGMRFCFEIFVVLWFMVFL